MTDFVKKINNAQSLSLFYVGQAGFIIKSNDGHLLAIDLYLSDCVERYEGHIGFKRLLPRLFNDSDLEFDVIICTHPHLDHFDVDSIPGLLNSKTILYCSQNCRDYIDNSIVEKCKDIHYISAGDNYKIYDFDLTFVNCDHGDSCPDAVGVIVKVDGKVIYFVGDSSYNLNIFSDIQNPLDIMVGPINGEYGNLNSIELSDLSMLLKPSVTIPCHYGMFASHGGNLKDFYDIMTQRKLPFYIMQYGEQLVLS